jgi:hypothetical protein
MQNSNGSDTRALLPGSDNRTPGDRGREMDLAVSRASPIDLAAFFTRLRNLNELVAISEHRRQRGSYSSMNLM